jgi:hypothetical protein
MPTRSMVYEILGIDNASPAFARAGASAEGAGRKLDGMAKAVLGFAAADLGYHAIKAAGQFEQLTNVLVTAAGESQKNLKTVRDGILNIASTTGTAWKEVADATYVAEKANYRGADALKVVKAAAQGAREENAKLSTVVNAVTSVMASYHLKSSDSVAVTNELKTAAGEAKTTMEEFAGSLSTVLPLASANKISFADVAGALGTLTQHGTTANEATQELANTIRNLSGSNAVARKEMAQLGIDSVDLQQKLGDGPGGRGLVGTLNYLSETVLKKMGSSGTVLLDVFNQSKQAANAAEIEFNNLGPAAQNLAKQFEAGQISAYAFSKGTREIGGEQSVLAKQFLTTYTNAHGFQDLIKQGGPQAQTYADAIKKMTGGANGLNTTLQITGESLDGTNERIKRIQASATNAGKDVSGWASTQKLFNVQMDMFKQSVEAAGIRIGTILLPPLKSFFELITKHPIIIETITGLMAVWIARWVALKALGLFEFLAGLATRILAVGTASGVAAGEAGLGRLAGGAAAARAILATEAGGGLAGAAGTATTRVAGLGAAFSTAAGLAGGFALALGGIALGIKEIFDDNKKFKLPSADDFGHAINKGGLTGQPGSKLIDQALSSTGTGNNKNENFQQYFQRVLGSSQAKNPLGFDKSQTAAIDATSLSMQKLKDILQKGTRGDLDEFKASLLDVEHTLNASPKTINTVTKFLDQLFDRYNSGREVTKRLADEMVRNEPKILGTSTSVAELSKQYGVNKQMAENLASGNKDLQDRLINVNSVLATNGSTLDGNSKAAQTNRAAIDLGVASVKEHAEAVYKQTGSLDAAQQAFSSGIKTIEDNAAALGINRDVTNDLILKLLGVKNNSQLHITVNADGTFSLQDISFSGDQQSLQSGHHAAGGHITGPGTGTSDSIPAWLSNGEFVVKAQQTAKFLPLLHAINDGKFQGFASGGLAAFDSAFGPTVNQHVDNLETRMAAEAKKWFDYRRSVDSTASEAATQAGPGQSLRSDHRVHAPVGDRFTQADPGLGRGGHSWHEAGDAVDFSGGDLEAMAAYWHKVAGSLLEEIHSPNYYVKNGRDVGPGFYGPDIVAQHYNHVHIAAGLGCHAGTARRCLPVVAVRPRQVDDATRRLTRRRCSAWPRLGEDQFPQSTPVDPESGWDAERRQPGRTGALRYSAGAPRERVRPRRLHGRRSQWGENYIASAYGAPARRGRIRRRPAGTTRVACSPWRHPCGERIR